MFKCFEILLPLQDTKVRKLDVGVPRQVDNLFVIGGFVCCITLLSSFFHAHVDSNTSCISFIA